jgi:polyphenol oxidase
MSKTQAIQSHTHNGLKYYYSAAWDGVKHGIFTRQGGVSLAPYTGLNVGGTVGDDLAAVRENHQRMYNALGVDPARACTTWQVHGADVVLAQGPVPGRKWLARADAIITNQPDTPLVMRFADCVPLLFFDPVQRAIGLAHAGWRGTVQGMAANTMLALQQAYGSRPTDMRVIIGPSISGAKFQVGEEVVQAVEDHYRTLDGLMQRDPADNSAYVDLWAANKLDLLRVGVLPEHIEVSGLCTYTRTDEFFSHRAEHGKTGRFGVVLSL